MNYNEFMESYYGFPTIPNIIPNMVNNNYTNPSVNLENPEEGFLKGNMFKNIYDQYKNYQYRKIVPTDEKSRLLYEIAMYSFAAHDLNLYLDLKENDSSVLMLFNDYRNKTNELINKYESSFGPINISGYDDSNVPFKWSSKSFPWTRGDNNV